MITKKVPANPCSYFGRVWFRAPVRCTAVLITLLTGAIEAAQAQNGNLLWAKRAGGLFDDQGNAVATDSQGNT